MATEENTTERWLPVPTYIDSYEVSNRGRVRTLTRAVSHRSSTIRKDARLLKPQKMRNGYIAVRLFRGRVGIRCGVHRLVLSAFSRLPITGEQANHKDFDKSNNCIENLEWTTAFENVRHAIDGGAWMSRGSHNGSSKLTEEDVCRIRAGRSLGKTAAYLADQFGVSDTTIRHICSGKTWQHLL